MGVQESAAVSDWIKYTNTSSLYSLTRFPIRSPQFPNLVRFSFLAWKNLDGLASQRVGTDIETSDSDDKPLQPGEKNQAEQCQEKEGRLWHSRRFITI